MHLMGVGNSIKNYSMQLQEQLRTQVTVYIDIDSIEYLSSHSGKSDYLKIILKN